MHLFRSTSEALPVATRVLLSVLIILFPLFFLQFSLDTLEISKQTLLVIVISAAMLTWSASLYHDGKISRHRGVTPWILWLLVGAFAVSSGFSLSPFMSVFGFSGQEYASVLTWAALALFFFLLTHAFHNQTFSKGVSELIFIGAILAGVIGLLSIFGFTPLASVLPAPSGNTIGSINGFALFLVATSLWQMGIDLFAPTSRSRIYFILPVITFLLLLVVDYPPLWIVWIIGLLVLLSFSMVFSLHVPRTSKVIAPSIFFVSGLIFLFFSSPPIQISLPSDVTPNSSASWSIVKDVLRERVLLGSGPGTYVFDYARFHGIEVNSTPFWDVRFDRAYSFFLTLLPTVGLIGFGLFILFIFSIIVSAIRGYAAQTKDRQRSLLALTPGYIGLIISFFFYPASLTIIFLFVLMGAGIYAQVVVEDKPFLWRSASSRTLVGIAWTTCILLFFFGIFAATQRYLSEAAMARAVSLDKAGRSVEEIVSAIDRSARLNRWNDTAYRNLAVVLISRLNKESQKLSQTPEPTAQQREYIQALAAASVNASVRATELSSSNVQNWLSRASVYRALASSIPDAGSHAVEAVLKVIELEPNNPSHWVELARANVAVHESLQAIAASKDSELSSQAQVQQAEALASAETALNRSIELKVDYAVAHFELVGVYEKQGRSDEAVAKMQRVVEFNPRDAGVWFQLGLIYVRRGASEDLANAERAFLSAIEIIPSYSNARWYLAGVYEQQGKIGEAVKQLEKVVELNPENATVKARLDRIRSGVASGETQPSVDAE